MTYQNIDHVYKGVNNCLNFFQSKCQLVWSKDKIIVILSYKMEISYNEYSEILFVRKQPVLDKNMNEDQILILRFPLLYQKQTKSTLFLYHIGS